MIRKYSLKELFGLREKFYAFQQNWYLKTPIDKSAAQFLLWLEAVETGIILADKIKSIYPIKTEINIDWEKEKTE